MGETIFLYEDKIFIFDYAIILRTTIQNNIIIPLSAISKIVGVLNDWIARFFPVMLVSLVSEYKV